MNVTIRGVNVPDSPAVCRSVRPLSLISAGFSWAKGLTLATACSARLPLLRLHHEDTQYLPRTNLWGQWTIKSNHSHFTSTITVQLSSPAFPPTPFSQEVKAEVLLMQASTSLLLAPLPSISLGDKIHKAERTGTVHAGIMWQHAVKHFLSTASAGVVAAAFRDGFLCSFQSRYLVFLRLILISSLLCEGLSLVSQLTFFLSRPQEQEYYCVG